jgi:predicted 3-demethylubiquinone-9 3-methyltransferase (glyoxalase superfamily)
MQKIVPFLWFDDRGEEAINFYTSVFKNSGVVNASYLPAETLGSKDDMFMGTFQIEGQQFHVLNGGPQFTFSQAVSFYVNCNTQHEIDDLWDKLSAGGETQQCGWLKDKFGLSWQIVPSVMPELMGGPDPARSKRVIQAMLQMNKMDIATLQRAYDGG